MHPEDFPSSSEEEYRYTTHNNDIEDERYQRFVAPIVDLVIEDFSPKNTMGLDYGAGTGPVITKLLSDQGYQLELYDPYFHPNSSTLKKKYDYIVCCEVVEHFHTPDAEFQRLFSLLKKGGRLYCMTDFLEEDQLFSEWYYKNDETHVAFFNPSSLQWIKNHFGFSHVEKKGRLVVFSKQ